jgi:hypothetical protein
MTLLRRALLIAILAATTLLPMVPAHAAFESTATAAAAPTPGGSCFWHPLQYSVDVPADTISWHLEIRVYSTSGVEHSTMTPNRFAGAPTTGTLQVEICPEDPEGTWRLQPVVTGWTDAQGEEHETEVPGAPSTFEVGTIAPLACPQCTIAASVDLRIVTIDGRRHARATLITRYDNERLRIQGARITIVGKRLILGDVLTDRRGVATLSRALRLGNRVRAISARGWIQYDDDNRLGLPQAASPWVRVR